MEHRIRAATLVVNNGELLLVKHVHPISGSVFWIPPGGGLNAGQESIFQCAAREVHEETGLHVRMGRILYVREFVNLEMDLHNLELFILAEEFEGEVTTDNVRSEDLDSQYIWEARFLSPHDMHSLTVFPHELKDQFWRDLESGDLETKYLGRQVGDSRKLPEA